GETAGPAVNSDGVVLPVMLKCTAWPLSFGGPVLMPVAQFGTLCAPLSSSTAWSGPFVNDGATLIGCTSMTNVCAADVSMPPFAVPPLSDSVSVIVAAPIVFVAGVYVSVPFAATAGPAENSAGLLLPVTLNVSVWPLSFGPALIDVAQLFTVRAPLFSNTDSSGAFVNDGGAFAPVAVRVSVCVTGAAPAFPVPLL